MLEFQAFQQKCAADTPSGDMATQVPGFGFNVPRCFREQCACSSRCAKRCEHHAKQLSAIRVNVISVQYSFNKFKHMQQPVWFCNSISDVDEVTEFLSPLLSALLVRNNGLLEICPEPNDA
jgi:hypothetical protein